MTLSRWLRDYLYISLGGNRGGVRRTYFNLFLTMLLGGLWHGAAWNFVIWGAVHGVLLVGHRYFRREVINENAPLGRGDIGKIFLLFHAVCFGWVFFRAPTFGSAIEFLVSLFGGGYGSEWPVVQTIIVVGCALLHPIERALRHRRHAMHDIIADRWWGPVAEGIGMGIVLGLGFAVSGAGGEFIYFQF